MRGELIREDVEAARKHLAERTLSKISGDFARLIYLASTRNYNTGEYHHEGLACMFTEPVAARALAKCHREVFSQLVRCPLKVLVEQLELYARINCHTVSDLVRIWERLEPYRATVPLESSAIAARFFASNIKAALAILESRQLRAHQGERSALPAP